MVAGSILPVTIYNKKLYFLFGKENKFEDSSPGWSDFGGTCENGETPYKTALRESSEELTGFLGNSIEIKKLIKKNGGIYKIIHNDYHVHIFLIKYDNSLINYYNRNHTFLWKNMDHKVLIETKLFEKSEIKWFSVDDIKKKRSKFRHFYRNIVNKILSDVDNIKLFIINNYKNNKIEL